VVVGSGVLGDWNLELSLASCNGWGAGLLPKMHTQSRHCVVELAFIIVKSMMSMYNVP
jgi:hypothetical protein